MGTEEPASDIDLVVFSTADHDTAGKILTALDALPTPYLFDVTDYQHVQHEGLKAHIDRVGKTLFKRQ